MDPDLHDRVIHSVSDLNQLARSLLEDALPPLWIEGEISNFACPSSGHWYFTLKDANAQIRCAMFQGRNRVLTFQPKNGAQVLVRGKVSLYEARGEYQLIADVMEEAGDGALRRAFELLKTKLAAEGLFDPAHKKLIPSLPKTIGVVTSPTGAAIRDVLSVLKRRFPNIAIIIYPTAVQGTAAAAQIVNAIQTANQRQECDVLIITRGGGSLEDLWPFNEEIVARAIYASVLPTISAVGHEIDFTIADFVADQRVPTPSAAAELTSPDQQEYWKRINKIYSALTRQIELIINRQQHSLLSLTKRLRHPGQRLQDQAQRLDEFEQRLRNALINCLHRKQAATNELIAKIQRYNPQFKIQLLQEQQNNLQQRLMQAAQKILQAKQNQLANVSRALDAISPLATLARGYAIVTDAASGKILLDANQVTIGSAVKTRLAQGQLICTVDGIGQ
jgi:exodeoxyribonuclease VII large subunit